MGLKTIGVLIIAAICIMQMLCSPLPDLTEELSRAEASVNNTLDSWRRGFESLFKDTNQLDNILENLGTQLQSLSDNIGNLTKHLEESIDTTPEPSVS